MVILSMEMNGNEWKNLLQKLHMSLVYFGKWMIAVLFNTEDGQAFVVWGEEFFFKKK